MSHSGEGKVDACAWGRACFQPYIQMNQRVIPRGQNSTVYSHVATLPGLRHVDALSKLRRWSTVEVVVDGLSPGLRLWWEKDRAEQHIVSSAALLA